MNIAFKKLLGNSQTEVPTDFDKDWRVSPPFNEDPSQWSTGGWLGHWKRGEVEDKRRPLAYIEGYVIRKKTFLNHTMVVRTTSVQYVCGHIVLTSCSAACGP